MLNYRHKWSHINIYIYTYRYTYVSIYITNTSQYQLLPSPVTTGTPPLHCSLVHHSLPIHVGLHQLQGFVRVEQDSASRAADGTVGHR